MDNPFSVKTPEEISADDAVSLFVDVFTDFHKITEQGHTILVGPRGSGKSMMYRVLMPDCQAIHKKKPLPDLDFFSIYIPIKKTNPNITEFKRLEEQHASNILNEHFLVMYIACHIFESIGKVEHLIEDKSSVKQLHDNVFIPLLRESGWVGDESNFTHANDPLRMMSDITKSVFRSMLNMLRQMSFPGGDPVYSGPLCGFFDFLYPFLLELKKLPFMPSGPIYLLIDDADHLNDIQTKILNTWISSRVSSDISIKVSTKNHYRTYLTVAGSLIETPHDYSEVNVSTVYTTHKGKYLNRVREIIKKRLSLKAGLGISPEEYFPEDKEQVDKIKEIGDKLIKEWPNKEKRGYRPGDDALRYARPEYISSLAGISKNKPNYKYCGFKEIVHCSSGIIRDFLEAAGFMYAEEKAKIKNDRKVESVAPEIQNAVLREQSDKFLYNEFEKMRKQEEDEHEELTRPTKLHNLLHCLGGTFFLKLISKDSERRVFSIAFSDTADKEVQDILDLGVRYGYFHMSTIGNKDGTGRTKLYIMSRKLAPTFSLDPSGFSGYLFVTNEKIKEALYKPDTLLRRMKKTGVSAEFEEAQLTLFGE